MSERRQAQRTKANGLSARVRPGHRVHVLNVSVGGALLEAARPLRPGSGVEVQFERPDGRLRVCGTVVRCGISALDPERGPTYAAAVSFNDTFDWAREEGTPRGYALPDAASRRRHNAGRNHK
jgi:hypothetical protein